LSKYRGFFYRWWFRRFFTFLIPWAFINYFPGFAILGREDPLGTSSAFQHLAPLAGPLFMLMALQVWKFGVRHYRSTGS
jgi:ABC-2 type transport system permease protein